MFGNKENSEEKKFPLVQKIILTIISFVLGFGAISFFKVYNKPFHQYERGLVKTLSENRVLIKNVTTKTNSNNNEPVINEVKYAVDKKNKIFQIDKNKEKNEQLTIIEDKMYIKNGEKFVNISDVEYLNNINKNFSFEGQKIYDEYQKELRDNIDKESVEKESIEKEINGKNETLNLLSFKVDKEVTKDIVTKYITNDFQENFEKIVDDTIETQVKMYENTKKEIKEEEKKKLKDSLYKKMEESLNEKISNMEYSDITLKIGIDKSGLIRYREENYIIKIEGEETKINNVTEYLSFGSEVQIEEITESKLQSFEEYTKEKKEDTKQIIKDYSLDKLDKKK